MKDKLPHPLPRVLASLHIILESEEHDDPIDSIDAACIRSLVAKAILFHPEILVSPIFCECCGATQ